MVIELKPNDDLAKICKKNCLAVLENDEMLEILKKLENLHKIGVLTSQTGAVIRDIINVSTRRNPNVQIRLFPVPVQGDGAAEKIAEELLQNYKNAREEEREKIDFIPPKYEIPLEIKEENKKRGDFPTLICKRLQY